LKYIIPLVFVFFIGCDSDIKQIFVFNYNPRFHTDSLNFVADSMISFTGYELESFKYKVYFPNYIGPYNNKFPELEYFPTVIYDYETILDGKFGFKDPKPMRPILSYFLPTRLSLFIDTTQYPQFIGAYYDKTSKNVVKSKKFNAYYLFIKNNSAFEIPIIIQNPYLFLLMEAKDKNNEWKPIEYISTALPFCGTGVNIIYLKEDYYILTKIPIYHGEFKTKIRIKLNVDGKIFYSNEIDMTINENQFEFPLDLFEKDSNSVKYSILNY
jgi:hypothetical protein